MRVASTFREANFLVSQGSHYEDPETMESREIDVIASKMDELGFLQISLVIECKSSKDKPWLLFTTKEQGNRLINFSMMSDFTRHRLTTKLTNDSDGIIGLPWFRKPDRNGYGLTVAFSRGDDPAFKAVLSALKAAIETYKPRNEMNRANLHFVFPTVVLDGRLFEAHLDANGEPDVNEIAHGYLTPNRTIAGHRCSSVRIVTTQHLPNFCTEVSQLESGIKSEFASDVEEMSQELKNRLTTGNKKTAARPVRFRTKPK